MSTAPKDESVQELASLYVAGALTAAERQAVETRIAAGDVSLRDAITALGATAEYLINQIEPLSPVEDVRANLVSEITGAPQAGRHHRAAPQPIKDPTWRHWNDSDVASQLFTLRADGSDWEATGVEGVWVRRLFADQQSQRMTALFRMEPGASYPQHTHAGAEECYVLQGDLHVGDLVLHAGDYQRAAEGSKHGIQSTEGGCLLLVTSSLHDEHEDAD